MAGLNIVVAASEVVGFAKTGGLADVAGALPQALAARGHRVTVIMPYYRTVRTGKNPPARTDHVIAVPVGSRKLACRLYGGTLPGSTVPVLFVDAPEYFDRDEPALGRGLYQQTMSGGYKSDYPDNAERYTFFCRAVVEAVAALGAAPDVIHANDWQTGLVPAFVKELLRSRPGFATVRTVFTIHNIAYQGMFGPDVMRLTGLPGWLFTPPLLEYHGHLNFMKAGIVFADAVNTVSPTYSREIQTAEFGCGLEGLLRANQHKLSGIVNGVDYALWNPATDALLPVRYDAETVFEQKPKCKAELQRRLGLPVDASRPVLGMVARLVIQKGVDLVLSASPGFLDLGCQIVFLGEGDPEYHNELQQFKARYPQQVGLYLGFDESLAHLVEAGSDLFLMPSRYEPCGLNQLYSLKYGTPPVVHMTGGLADTVVNATQESIDAGTGTGFGFGEYTAHALYETVKWALHLSRDRPAAFGEVVTTAMRQDWSWARSAADYEGLYRRVML
ncbi:glycogen synthase GlgA [Fimbriiglobus ruber]|uniref:Glycogen synthase n=1 Tax=Fimbriiglobus ruber TaxID=1908690 RepID=A0A225DH97_9BACT|nr:glycogen synthase GlgA [Fimbriiglobus ruber]OWK40363.1 glycogen synthase [Fimbriiglobus ruber]